ncbi:MAG: bifunctional methylenetetrahydrofolate dehydrogenase/methenyltetrahydrofolate cyclohydrolase FolD [Alphaproteobacteria bacterium]
MAEATSAARIIDGKALAAEVRARVAADVRLLKERHGLTPGLAVVLVGDNPASQVYVGSKRKMTLEVGMRSLERNLATETSEADLLAEIRRLNDDATINGILVQLPLPPQIREAAVIEALDPKKDVDGFHTRNVGELWTGSAGMVPCTPLGCLMLLEANLPSLAGLSAVVVGRSNIVGKPVAALLLGRSCTVTIAHSRTRDLPGECRRADILVAAVGKPELVRGDWIKPGATVIDVGINRIAAEGQPGKSRLVGDVAFAEAVKVAGAVTPVPGGVGPMTIACLLRNTVTATCRQAGIAPPS